MAIALMCTTGLMATGASETAKLVLGKKEATKERIDKGALFIDGLFIRGPYTVTREGNLILVNGKIAARLKIDAVEDESADEDAEATDEAVVAEEETESSETTEEDVAEVEMPNRTRTRADIEAAAKERTDAARKRSGQKSLLEKEAERKKAKIAKPKPAFNQEVVSTNPNALFEEADYTYTPPQRAEPKAVPYIRPAQKMSLKERLAAEEAEKAAKVAAEAEVAEVKDASNAETAPEVVEDQPSEEEIAAAEDAVLETLTEEEAARYIKALDARHKQIEVALQRDYLVFLSSSTVAWKASPKALMQRFILSLEKDAGSAEKFAKAWNTLPQSYLRRVYKYREENSTNTKTLRLRIQREQRAAKDKPKRV